MGSVGSKNFGASHESCLVQACFGKCGKCGKCFTLIFNFPTLNFFFYVSACVGIVIINKKCVPRFPTSQMASGREKNVGRTFLLSTHTSHVKGVCIINKCSCDAVFFKTDNFGDANQNVGRAQKVRPTLPKILGSF